MKRKKATSHTYNKTRDRLAELSLKYNWTEYQRMLIHGEIEAAARHWFVQAGGTEADFERLFN